MKLKLLTIIGLLITFNVNAVEPMVGFGTINLKKHEGISDSKGNRAHTILKHVNAADTFLINRVEDDTPVKNQKEIDTWEKKCKDKKQDFSKTRKNTRKAKLFGGLVDASQNTNTCSVKPKPICDKAPKTSFESLTYANDMINKIVSHPTKGMSSCSTDGCTLRMTSVAANSSYGFVRNDSCEIVKIPKGKLTGIEVKIKTYKMGNDSYWYVNTMYPTY